MPGISQLPLVSALTDGDSVLLHDVEAAAGSRTRRVLWSTLKQTISDQFSTSITQANTAATNASNSATAASSSASSAATSATTAQTAAAGSVSMRFGGRLTLSSGLPVTASDVAGASTVYYTPTVGNVVPIWDGTTFVSTTFAEMSLPLTATNTSTNYHQAAKNFDVFAALVAGTLRIGTGPAWTSDTARGTGAGTTQVSQRNGVYVNTASLTLRHGSAAGDTATIAAERATYLGTFRATADGLTEDSATKRFLWNIHNQALRKLLRRDTTASWTHSLASYRQANGSAANQVAYVAGLSGGAVSVKVQGGASSDTAGSFGTVGVGLDQVTVDDSDVGDTFRFATASVGYWGSAEYTGSAGLGYHFLAWLERGNGTGIQTWQGYAQAFWRTGIAGEVWG